VLIKSEQKRAESFRAAGVAKAAHDAISAADLFDFERRVALARPIRHLRSLCDHAIEIAAGFFEPLLCLLQIRCGRGNSNRQTRSEILLREFFEELAPFLKWSLQKRLPARRRLRGGGSILSGLIEDD